MALLRILEYPDPRLRTRARPVEHVDVNIRQLIDDMLETMYQAPGIGLAATQVDVHKRVLVLDISETKDQPYCLINPEIIEKSGLIAGDEGCLSVPDVTESVERAEFIRVKALDRDGNEFENEAEGLLAVCIQHEMDHLEGKLFVDLISELKRQRIRKKLTKSRKRGSETRSGAPSIPAI